MASPFRILSLCSGIGGLDLGVHLAVDPARTICYVEREAFAVATLVAAMEEHRLAPAPVFPDIATFDGRPWAGAVDCVVAGVPCQPVSLSGKRLGTDDTRWLWPEVLRILTETKAPYLFLENVPGMRTKGLDTILEGLASIGFDAEWCSLSAKSVGAPHERNRWFLLAYTNGERQLQPSRSQRKERGRTSYQGALRHTNGAGLAEREGKPSHTRQVLTTPQRAGGGPIVSSVGGVVHGAAAWLVGEPTSKTTVGYSGRAEAIMALGNGVVPQQAAEAFRVLFGWLHGD
jgi:DNA (cytosine-5)-methyltransferase 1